MPKKSTINQPRAFQIESYTLLKNRGSSIFLVLPARGEFPKDPWEKEGEDIAEFLTTLFCTQTCEAIAETLLAKTHKTPFDT